MSYTKIKEIINCYFNDDEIKTIDSNQFLTSGTDYIYPCFCDEKITSFIDMHKRKGFLFQITYSSNNKNDQIIKKRSCFLIHQRYTNDDSPIVYNGNHYFYHDCILRSYDLEIFYERLNKILKSETLIISKGDFNYQFKLEINNKIEHHKQRFVTSIESIAV